MNLWASPPEKQTCFYVFLQLEMPPPLCLWAAPGGGHYFLLRHGNLFLTSADHRQSRPEAGGALMVPVRPDGAKEAFGVKITKTFIFIVFYLGSENKQQGWGVLHHQRAKSPVQVFHQNRVQSRQRSIPSRTGFHIFLNSCILSWRVS